MLLSSTVSDINCLHHEITTSFCAKNFLLASVHPYIIKGRVKKTDFIYKDAVQITIKYAKCFELYENSINIKIYYDTPLSPFLMLFHYE